MKASHDLHGNCARELMILLLVALSLISILNINTTEVSAVESPYIKVVPESIVDPSLIPGENFTVSIYTDYTGWDVTLYQFNLFYNPNVLQGVEVTNGDLITADEHPMHFASGPVPECSAWFLPGPFDNTAGELSLTLGLFKEKEIAAGPGTLANVTFTVVDRGAFNITIGPLTKLIGWDIFGDKEFVIVDAAINATHIQHGYFNNRFQRDVRVGSVRAPDKVPAGSLVPINVTVANIGESVEVANVTIRHDSALIGFNDTVALPKNYTDTWTGDNVTKTFITTGKPLYWDSERIYINQTLMTKLANYTINYEAGKITFAAAPGLGAEIKAIYLQHSTTVSFSWNTTGLAQGTYTLNATATIPGDGDPTDNWNTTTIHIVAHDVAVGSITAPDKAAAGEFIPISVEVANEGALNVVANVTIRHDSTYIDSKNVTLATGANTTASFSWNTTGLAQGTYTLNATATIPLDDDPTDNWNTTTIHIVEHDVTIISLDAPAEAAVGDSVFINVTVANIGSSNENVTLTISCAYEHPSKPPPTVIDARSFMINMGLFETISFSWNTTGLETVYPYTVDATATIPLDDDPTDNFKTTKIALTSHDIEILSLTPSPYSLFAGELMNIEVNVKNVGDYNETFDVEVSYDTSIITEFRQNKLPPGNSTILSYNWNTTGVATGSYKMRAEAVLPRDAKPDSNLKTRDVFINPPLGTIAGAVADASTGLPIEGVSVNAGNYINTTDAEGNYTLRNIPAGAYNITASAAGYESSSQADITVVAGETILLNFNLTPLSTIGTIAGVVLDSSNGDPIADATVTANGMFATTNSSGAYVISNVLAGTYSITASAAGYESSSRTGVIVVAGNTTQVDFELTPVQPSWSPNILLYAGVAIIAIVILVGIAIYVLKAKKQT